MEKLREIENGQEYFLLSHRMLYDTISKKILIYREATLAEEKGIPYNNDYPYGQGEILELEYLHFQEKDNTTTMYVVIQDELKKENINRIIKKLETK